MAKFEGTATTNIDEKGTLTVKFKESAVKKEVIYELSGKLQVIYLGPGNAPFPKEYTISNNKKTTSSTESIVDNFISSPLPAVKPGQPKVLSYVKFDHLLLKDLTNSIELKINTVERKFHVSAPVSTSSSLTKVHSNARQNTIPKNLVVVFVHELPFVLLTKFLCCLV